MVEELHLQSRVAIWAMDVPHYEILMEATHGQAQVIWAYMDQVPSSPPSQHAYPCQCESSAVTDENLSLREGDVQ
jgi:hypothetical protein